MFLVLCIFFPVFSLPAGAHGIKYHEFKPVDHRLGMDASAVYCMVQDRHGLIWMGTDRGLYNFDGYQARHLYPLSQSAAGNEGAIYCAVMVDTARLWLGSDNGLFVFNTYTDSYENSPAGLPENIRSISRINDHLFWIGSINGLYRYDSATGISERIEDRALPHQAIYTILRYDDDTYYFGTYNGLCRYSISSGRFENVSLNTSQRSSNLLILTLLPDYRRNCIWVGVEGGLYAYYPYSGETKTVSLFNGNSVKSLLLDNTQCLWAGTDNGLYIYEPAGGDYRVFRHDAINDHSLLNNVVWTVFTDKEQNIWVGTDAGVSLYIFNDHFHTQSISEITGSNEGNYIISVLSDSKNKLWLGGNNGLIMVERSTGKTIWYQQNNSRYPLPHNKVRYVFEDADGDIWIATDGSICRYNEKTLQFIRYQIEDTTHTRNANWSYAICQDETGKLWIATCLGGLFVVDKNQLIASEGKTYVAERNYYPNNGAQGLSGNMLQFLARDTENNIWVGTYKAGVNKIDRMNHKVYQFSTLSSDMALPSDDVTAMIIGNEGMVWIALRDQVARIDQYKRSISMVTDPRMTNSCVTAMADDGRRIWMSLSSGLFFIEKSTLRVMQINTSGNYYTSIFYDKATGRMIAGGINEYVEFDPESMLSEDQQNNLYITTLRINNRLEDNSFMNKPDEKINESIRFIRQIELPFNRNNLSFTYSEFSYNRQQNVQYAYKLDNLDSDWQLSARGNNHITYNNLSPGDYTLLISRIGSDGNPLPEPLKFSIRINHPWYSTWLAKSIYIIILLLLITGLINYIIVLNRLRYERIEKAKTMELTAHKIDFLTNISHELKTPLSLIIGPLGRIIEQARPASLKSELADVRQHALKMGTLIHQLMEASRQEFDDFGLILARTDIVLFVRSLVMAFGKHLDERGISIAFECPLQSFYIEADILKLEVIINNILSNASKFAPDGSVITIRIDTAGGFARVSITDEGPGIDERDLPHIFERFFQSRHSLPQNREGSGVGLAIVREYVQMHNGSVRVVSDGESGTTVEIMLPVTQSQEAAEQTVYNQKPSVTDRGTGKPLLLIVEDNIEISTFISKSLADDFRCVSAVDGRDGLQKALSEMPDIIVSDIMMPVMDGIEMCRKLKENISTSTIPVVMLTAKDDKSTELQGYKTGADAFIAKPFEISYLSDRLHHLLKSHSLIVKKAREKAIIQPRDEETMSTDEKFLTVITQIIENEITNPDLNVNVLSEKSGYSLKQIYRRIKSLTGQTAVDYIRTVRLKKAAMLLSRKTFTVSEVMYMVGFSSHSYFSKRFQELFGKSPRSYAEEASGNNVI